MAYLEALIVLWHAAAGGQDDAILLALARVGGGGGEALQCGSGGWVPWEGEWIAESRCMIGLPPFLPPSLPPCDGREREWHIEAGRAPQLTLHSGGGERWRRRLPRTLALQAQAVASRATMMNSFMSS